jgi:hypothetical protein
MIPPAWHWSWQLASLPARWVGNGAIEKLDVGGDAAVVAAALEGDGEVVELAVVFDEACRGFRLDTLVNICPCGLVGQVADGEVGEAQGLCLGVALELEGPGSKGEDIALVFALLELRGLLFGRNPNGFHPVLGALGGEDETTDHAEENWSREGVGLSLDKSANGSGQ